MNKTAFFVAASVLMTASTAYANTPTPVTDFRVQSEADLARAGQCVGTCSTGLLFQNHDLKEDFQQPMDPRAISFANRAKSELEAGNFERSATLFHRALRVEPKNARLLYLTGGAHFVAGDFAKSEPLLKRAVREADALSSAELEIAENMLSDLSAD